MVTRLLRSTAIILCILACAKPSRTSDDDGSLRKHLAQFRAAPEPHVEIQIVSAQKTFRTGLSPEAFKKYLATIGPDYILVVRSPERAIHLADTISDLRLTSLTDIENVDLRQRLEFSNRGGETLVLYSDGASRLFYDGRLFDAGRGDWTKAFWQYMGKDFVGPE